MTFGRGALLWLKAHFPQPREKLAIDFVSLRLQKMGQPLKVYAQLVA